MQRSHLIVSILVVGIIVVGAFGWHGYQKARQRAIEAQQATEAAAAKEQLAADIRQQQQQKREDFARACTEGTKFGVTCSAGGQDGTILAVAYGHANEDFLKGLVSDADSEGQPAQFGRDLAAMGFTVLMATGGKRYWAAEPCSGGGICKWYQEASEPNPWIPTQEPPPESLRLSKTISLVSFDGHVSASYGDSFYAGKIVALASESPISDKFEPESQPASYVCALEGGHIYGEFAYVYNVYATEGTEAGLQAFNKQSEDIKRELFTGPIQELIHKKYRYAWCASQESNEKVRDLLNLESELTQGELDRRLDSFAIDHNLYGDTKHEFPRYFEPPVAGENLRVEEAYLTYVEGHGLVKQWMVEDLAEVQVISRQH